MGEHPFPELATGFGVLRSASPHLNGKVSNALRICAEEFYRMLAGVVIDDTGVFNDKLRE
ncbi:hypothetical protein [Streptomyces goshikiensis]|uniref:hypothetical protein n=1 Tax=Streptomyces goshikiensis TaxID=1942 RepID=UPI0036579466